MKNIYKRHRFPPSIIQYAVWLYYERDEERETDPPAQLDLLPTPQARMFEDKYPNKSTNEYYLTATRDVWQASVLFSDV